MTDRCALLCCGMLLLLSGCAAGPAPIQPAPAEISEEFTSQDEPVPAECTLAEALSVAWYRHPAMQRAQHLVAAQHGERVQAGLWPRPDAKIFLLDKPNETETGVMLAQKFELGGKRKARVSEAAARIFLAEAEMRAQWSVIKTNVKGAFARLAFRQQSSTLLVKIERIAKDYTAMSASLYRAGKLSETKLIEARQREALASSAVVEAQARLRDATQDVLISLGVSDSESPVSFTCDLVALPVPAGYEVLLEQARKGSPKLAVARVEAEVAKASRALARAARSMDATIGLTFKEFSRDEFEGGSAVGAQVSFDLPLWNRGQGSVVAGDERASAAEANEQLAELGVARELSGLLSEYTAWQAKSDVYEKEIIPLEKKNFRLAENKYKSGTASKIGLIEARSSLEVRHLEYLQARFMLSIAGIELERIVLSHLPQD